MARSEVRTVMIMSADDESRSELVWDGAGVGRAVAGVPAAVRCVVVD